MTRVNCGIPPAELSNKHLIAEHREIKRIPNMVASGRYHMKGQPEKFTLGTGHVKFFYDKLLYLKERYTEIHEECKRRGFNVTDFTEAWDGVPENMMNGYEPSEADRKIVRARIKERS